MNPVTADELRHVTEETLDYLQESKRSLEVTIADARRTIETSRKVLRDAGAKVLPPAIDAD